MEQRERKKEEPKRDPIIKEEEISSQNNKKSLAEKSLSDFMKDSLFDDKPKMKRIDTG